MSNSFQQPVGAGSGRPSKVQHFVVFATMLMAVLLYLDRLCIALAEPYIKQDLGLSTFQIDFFFSAFFLTYALFQVPSGWLSNHYGAWIMLVIYVLAWSFFTDMMGLSYGFIMLLICGPPTAWDRRTPIPPTPTSSSSGCRSRPAEQSAALSPSVVDWAGQSHPF